MTCHVFLGAVLGLVVGFIGGLARLSFLARGGLLQRASHHAYDELGTGLARVGPLGAAPGMSRLVAVRFSDMAIHEDFAIEAMRWEAIGPGGALFPALDADIKLTPAGEDAIMLMVAGDLPAAAGRPGHRTGPGDHAPGRPVHDPGRHPSHRGRHRAPGRRARSRTHLDAAGASSLARARHAVDPARPAGGIQARRTVSSGICAARAPTRPDLHRSLVPFSFPSSSIAAMTHPRPMGRPAGSRG